MLRLKAIHISWIVLALSFILARIYWYSVMPLPGISSDTTGYIEAALSMLEGRLPHFDFRNPGYPLLLLIPLVLGKGLIGVVLMQSLLALGSALFLVYELHRYLGRAAVAGSAALALFLVSNQQLTYESSVLSDAPFAALMMLFTGLLLRSIRRGGIFTAILLGFTWGMLLLLRPVALFLLPVLAFWAWNGLSKGKYRAVLAALAVGAAMWAGVSFYNLGMDGKFGLSGTSALNSFGATITYAAPGPEYPRSIVESVRELQESIPREEKELLRHSTDPRVVMALYTEYYEKMWPVLQATQQELQAQGPCPSGRISCLFPMLKSISREAIAGHPGLFLRYWGMSFSLTAIRNRCTWDPVFPQIMHQRREILQHSDLRNILDPALPHNARLLDRVSVDLERLNPAEPALPLLSRVWYRLQGWLDMLLFFNRGFIWTFFILIGGVYALYRRFVLHDNRPAIILLLYLSTAWFSYTLLSTAMVYPLERLSYPVEWMKYLAAILFLMFTCSHVRMFTFSHVP